jgi:hypothetical protein
MAQEWCRPGNGKKASLHLPCFFVAGKKAARYTSGFEQLLDNGLLPIDWCQ